MIQRAWSRLPRFLKNKYAVAIMAFVIWLAFFDQHNLINQVQLRSELYQLETDKEYYSSEIIKIREDLDELLSDNDKLERFAREKYFMKRANEEIFVFTEED